MAGAGYKLFSTGDVLSASDVNTYLQQQTVMVFASAAARTTALASVLAEGMVTYLKDTDVVEIYTGAAWVSLDDPNAIQNSIVTAKGNIITATASGVPAVLAVGSNNQTLVADSTASTGLKWATPTSTATAKGVSVFGSSGSQGILNNTWTAITWDSETFDTDAFHSTSSNTSRYTIPAGLAGKYSIKMQLLFNLSATGYRNIRLYKNGAVLKEGNEVTGSSAQYVGSYINADLDLIVGDYIELFAYQNCGTTLNTYTTVLNSTYSMMYWGA